VQKLKEEGLFVEENDHEMTLRICSRSKDVIEPMLKPQWYVSMKDMAAQAYNAVENGDLIINPKFSEAEFKRWMETIRDWCISRQLWWGHQAPVYYVQLEGEKQDVSSSPYLANCSETLGNGGLLGDQRTSVYKRLQLNFPGNHLPLNEILMCLTLGSPPVFGHSQQWVGPTK
jgi:valyl-tRNA synthetase